MNAPYSPGYNPYSSNELDELERQRHLLVAPPPTAPDPMAGIGYDQATAGDAPTADFSAKPASWLRSHNDSPEYAAFKADFQDGQNPDTWDDAAWARAERERKATPAPITPHMSGQPSLGGPLDLSADPSTVRKGMGVSSITRTGIADPERAKLEDLHRQLTGEKLGQIEQSGAAEKTIAERGLGAANARGIEAANQEVYKRRELEDSQRKQAELKKQQDEWAQKKEDGDALKAFGGNELAMVLTGIGMAAGTFSQAMGWQNANPVKDMFDKTIERSLASQREQKNSRLNLLTARLGDEKAAELQVRGEMHDAIATRLAAQAQGTQYQDSLDRLNPLMQDQANKAKEYQLAAHEALVPKQTVTQTALAPKGGVDPLERAKKGADAAMAMEKAGVPKEEIVAFLKSNGYQAPTGKSAAELEREDKAAAKKELTPAEKTKLTDKVDGLAESVQAARELDQHVGYERGADGEVVKFDEKKLSGSIPNPLTQIAGAAANTLPWGMSKGAGETVAKMRDEDVKKLERIRDQIVFGQAKADGQGALSGADRDVYRAYIPTDSPLSLSKASAEQWRKRQQAYKNLSAENKELVDARLRERGVDPAKEFASQ